MKRTNAGELDVTTGRTAPPLTDGHEMPHVEDLIADGHMTPRAQTVAICAAIMWTELYGRGAAVNEVMGYAIDIVTRAEEWDRHERFQKR